MEIYCNWSTCYFSFVYHRKAIYWYQLGEGWYVNSAPIITADWTVDSEDRWIVPLGGGGGKLLMIGGKLPLNLQTQLYYNVVRPDFGPEWQWRVQAQVLLPTSIFGSN